MVFTILTAADLHGTKLNYELDFGAPPSLPELRDRIESVFGAEAAARRPADVPNLPFVAHRMQTFDDRVELWVDLVNAHQLQDYSQVYVFQKETAWHKEVQSKIPPPVKPPLRASSPSGGARDAALAAAVHASSPHHAASLRTHDALAAQAQAHAAASAHAAGVAASYTPHHASPPPLHHHHHHLPPGHHPLTPTARDTAEYHALLARHSHSPQAALLPHHHAGGLPPLAAAQAHTPYGHASVPGVPSEATHAEKVRIVYDELDVGKIRVVHLEEWATLFDKVKLADYAGDLFVKADANKDGKVSFDEFSRFGEQYPTVLDALYYRLRDFWLVKKHDDSIEASQRTLAMLREKEAEARNMVAHAMVEVKEQEDRVRQQAAEVAAAQSRERDALAVLEAAAQETERCRAAVAQHAHDLQVCREKQAKLHVLENEAKREHETAHVRAQLAADETARALQRLQDIQRLLEEQQAEVAKRKEAETQLQADVLAAENRTYHAASALEDAAAETKMQADRLQISEQELMRAQERERECGMVHLQARDDAAKQLVRKEAIEHELLVAKETVARRQAAEEAAARSVDVQTKATKALQDESLELASKIAATRQDEGPLIASEVRLRHQRDALEAEEALLRTNHQTFHHNTGRANLPSPRGIIPSGTPSEFASPHRLPLI
ncbi:calmodulin-like protein containing EF hand domain [Diplonema papillatum]|nr:calmodulin-like protein containing EF hand domain [Diplonema papillatum]